MQEERKRRSAGYCKVCEWEVYGYPECAGRHWRPGMIGEEDSQQWNSGEMDGSLCHSEVAWGGE